MEHHQSPDRGLTPQDQDFRRVSPNESRPNRPDLPCETLFGALIIRNLEADATTSLTPGARSPVRSLVQLATSLSAVCRVDVSRFAASLSARNGLP